MGGFGFAVGFAFVAAVVVGFVGVAAVVVGFVVGFVVLVAVGFAFAFAFAFAVKLINRKGIYMKKIILIAMLAVIPVSAKAEYRYDYESGNSYNINRYGNTTQVYGNNFKTGNSWNSTYDNRTGNAYGYDSQGNNWNYNHSSGYYTNSNGHGCSGHGASRFCW